MTLVGHLRHDGPEAHLAAVFASRPRQVEDAWRAYLRELARPSVD
jgi:hypothetical protein